jgi:hypothetical protein
MSSYEHAPASSEPVAPEPDMSIELVSETDHNTTAFAHGVMLEFQESSDTWRNEWEEGRIDYMGRDSYDNIQDYMQSVLEQPPTQRPWVVDEPEETGEEEEIVVKVELIETIYQGPPSCHSGSTNR